MKPPRFWNNSSDNPSWQALLLTPVAWVISMASKKRVARGPDLSADVPVICVGNINIGGTGKTPTAIALAQHLILGGVQPHFVSRGYGGNLAGPIRVDEKSHRAGDVGDEPLLLAAFAPTWVARDRAAGVRAAQQNGADVIILDDGFQNPTVAKSISIVVVDAAIGFGNGRVFPAGPLRETIANGLKRADLLVTIGQPSSQQTFDGNWPITEGATRCQGELVPLETGMDWKGARVLAFAGIGHPQKFFDTLTRLGAILVDTKALDDHQPYTPAMINRLRTQAQSLNAQLVTTEKDAVRLPPEFRPEVLSIVVRLEIHDWTPIEQLLETQGINLRQ